MVVNPAQIRSFAKALGQRAKTDPIDAAVIARFAEATRPEIRPLPDKATRLLVMTDEPGVAIAAGKPIEFEPIFTLLAEEGLWDQTPILSAIHDQRFDLIVLTESLTAPHPPFENERITLAVRNAIAADYDEVGQANDDYLYRPKGRGG